MPENTPETQTPDTPAATGAVDVASSSAVADAPAEARAQPAAAEAVPINLPNLKEGGAAAAENGAADPVSLLNDVELNVSIELGRTEMLVEDVLKLGEGSVVELDKLAGDPVDVFVNDRLVARGEVLVLNDSFCVRVSEIVAPADGE